MFELIKDNFEIVALIILAVYELISRRIPTEGNWSIVHLAVKVLDIVVKNKAKSEEKSELGEPVKKTFKLRKTKK